MIWITSGVIVLIAVAWGAYVRRTARERKRILTAAIDQLEGAFESEEAGLRRLEASIEDLGRVAAQGIETLNFKEEPPQTGENLAKSFTPVAYDALVSSMEGWQRTSGVIASTVLANSVRNWSGISVTYPRFQVPSRLWVQFDINSWLEATAEPIRQLTDEVRSWRLLLETHEEKSSTRWGYEDFFFRSRVDTSGAATPGSVHAKSTRSLARLAKRGGRRAKPLKLAAA